MNTYQVISLEQENILRRLMDIGATLQEAKLFVMTAHSGVMQTITEELDALDTVALKAMAEDHAEDELFDADQIPHYVIVKRLVIWHFRALLKSIDN